MLQAVTNWDAGILLFIQAHLRIAALTPIMEFLSLIGEGGTIWIILSVLLLFFKKTRKAGLISLVSMALVFLTVNVLIKPAVARVRPYNLCPAIHVLGKVPTDYSFPSGHTANGFAASLIMVRMLPKKFGIPAVVLAAAIAWSRLYNCAHYPTDVICGFLIALVISQLVWYFLVKRRADQKV